MILEVLKILEAEVNLREETRVAEQSKAGVTEQHHADEAGRLSQTQRELGQRVDAVIVRVEELPDGDVHFIKEIDLLSAVSRVMNDATEILASPSTGSDAMAAETEAIELLLRCQRINPNAGGAGGTSPGGGGQGDTQDSALALLGTGLNQKEQRRIGHVTQSTGESGRARPEEFRAGLDEYFHRLETSQ